MGSIKVGSTGITRVFVGNVPIRKAYVGSTLIWSAPAAASTAKLTTVATEKNTSNTGIVLRYGSTKKIIITNFSNNKLMIVDANGARSSSYVYSDYTHTNLVNPYGLAEDPSGYIWCSAANSGHLFKLQLATRTTNSKTDYYLKLIKEQQVGSLVAANQVVYCAARNSMILTGWGSGGSTSYGFQIPLDYSKTTQIAHWWGPTLSGCFTTDGKRYFIDPYADSNRFAYFDFSSASDVAEKTSYTYVNAPTGYSPDISGYGNDARYIFNGQDGFMYMHMLNGSVYKYKTDATYVGKVGTLGDGSPNRSDCVPSYDRSANALIYSKNDGLLYYFYL